jgi:hypothetical protein
MNNKGRNPRFSKCPKAYLAVFLNSAGVAAGIPMRITRMSLEPFSKRTLKQEKRE